MRAGLRRELLGAEELVELRERVVGVGVVGVGRCEVRRVPRQPRGVGREILERDLAPVPARHRCAGGKEGHDGIVEVDRVVLDHEREQRRGEGLGDRPDLEHGVAVEPSSVARIAGAGDTGGAVRAHDAGDDAGAAPALHAVVDDALELADRGRRSARAGGVHARGAQRRDGDGDGQGGEESSFSWWRPSWSDGRRSREQPADLFDDDRGLVELDVVAGVVDADELGGR